MDMANRKKHDVEIKKGIVFWHMKVGGKYVGSGFGTKRGAYNWWKQTYFSPPQYIVLCLTDRDDPQGWQYIQATRRRFDRDAAIKYKKGVAKCRRPIMVKVPHLPLDEKGYPKL